MEKEIEPLGYVESIFPGEIKPTKGTTPRLKLRFKYATSTGAKLLAYGPSSVQEVFVVSKDIGALKGKLASLFE